MCAGVGVCRFGKFYNGGTFNIQAVEVTTQSGAACKKEPGGVCHDWSDLAATAAVVYRGNVVDSNGGFQIASCLFTKSVRDVIIEGNTVQLSDADKALQIAPQMTHPTNGTCVVTGNVLPQPVYFTP